MRATQPVVEKLTRGRLAEFGGLNLETIRYLRAARASARAAANGGGVSGFPREAGRRLRFQDVAFSIVDLCAANPSNCWL